MDVSCDVRPAESEIPEKIMKYKKYNIVDFWLAFVSVAATLGVLAWLIFYSRYGFDFTDESYYLVWVANPGMYDWSLSQFGFLYHPFYVLFAGDVVFLRVFNIFLTFALSWFLVDLVIRDSFSTSIVDSVRRISISFGFAVGGLVFFSVWIPSPSYNSLNFQAFIIVAIGLTLAQKQVGTQSVIGWLLIGVGGWLVFMAKPSSAAAIGVTAFIYIVLSHKINIRMMVLCALVLLALFVCSALLIDGSLIGFERRLQTALIFLNYLGGGHTVSEILRIDDFSVSKRDFIIFISLLFYCSVSAVLLKFDNKFFRLFGVSFVALALAGLFLILVGGVVLKSEYNNFSGLLMFVIPAAMLLLGVCFYWKNFISDFSRQRLLTASMFLLLPHAYAFGTNNNYWQVGSAAGFFWLLAGLVLIAPVLRRHKAICIYLPLVMLTQFVVVILVQRGMELPYRQPQSLRINSHSVEIGSHGSRLVLSDGYASYLEDAINVSRTAGFKSGTPVIDLTGQSPGILYSIGATNVGQAWTIGGYAGSFKLAVEALKKVPCEQLSLAWVLTEAGGPRSISDDIFSTFGASLSDYVSVGSWATAKGAGGYDERPKQSLLKPLNSIEVSRLCNDSRRILSTP